MSDKIYGVLLESDKGLDVFGNAKGKPILMESVGDMMGLHEATEKAKSCQAHGKYGKAIVVELVIHEVIF